MIWTCGTLAEGCLSLNLSLRVWGNVGLLFLGVLVMLVCYFWFDVLPGFSGLGYCLGFWVLEFCDCVWSCDFGLQWVSVLGLVWFGIVVGFLFGLMFDFLCGLTLMLCYWFIILTFKGGVLLIITLVILLICGLDWGGFVSLVGLL